MNIPWTHSISQETLESSARRIADWILRNQYKVDDSNAAAGNFLWMAGPDGSTYPGNNWNCAFAAMGLMRAADQFGEEKYRSSALAMGNYLKSLQIFSPFLKKHYGAIRELSPQCPWCYTRDALSAAWGFLDLYKYTHDPEYLERAVLWTEWFRREGMDSDGWPKWGIDFEPPFPGNQPHARDNMQGCFHGGGLNFFERLAQVTGDPKYTGKFYENIADLLVSRIQQPDGFFISVERSTGKPPETDPQGGLHRSNDDFCTLGLLGAWKIYHKPEYRRSIERFLAAVFARQDAEGSFEQRCAGIPVVLNTVLECGDEFPLPEGAGEKCVLAMNSLLKRQFPESAPGTHAGAFDENLDGWSSARSACYALLLWLKLLKLFRSGKKQR